MAVKASLRNYRISASKARLVVDQIRGRGVEHSLNILDQSDKKFAQPLAKLLRSAVANAEAQNESKHAQESAFRPRGGTRMDTSRPG